MSPLKPCPCGQTPAALNTKDSGTRWNEVSGNCCGEWWVEFRAMYAVGDTLFMLAEVAWNKAPRPEADPQ